MLKCVKCFVLYCKILVDVIFGLISDFIAVQRDATNNIYCLKNGIENRKKYSDWPEKNFKNYYLFWLQIA